MSLVYEASSGVVVATGNAAMFEVKTFLKSRGWTVPSSGDATSYFSGSDGITTSASGAGGLANTNAWFRLKAPTGTREFLIQRGSSSLLWRAKYSPTGFTGGSPSATVAPTAADQQHLRGADTPTFVTILPTDNTYKLYGCADTESPYGFCFLGIATGLTTVSFVFCADPVVSLPDSTDTDQYVYNLSLAAGGAGSGLPATGGTGWARNSNTLPNSFCGFLNGTFTQIALAEYVTYDNSSVQVDTIPGKGGQYNSLTLDMILPAVYMRNSTMTAPVGTKGVSYFFAANSGNRAVGDTVSVAGSKDWLVMDGGWVLRWNNTVPS